MDTHSLLPEKFLERLTLIYGEKKMPEILKGLNEKQSPSFRVNTVKSSAKEVEKMLHELNFEFKNIYWYADAYILLNKTIRELTDTDIYKKGYIYIQNISSMLPALVLSPQDNETILDIAAAPGSKTTQLAALMHNTGSIMANDLSFKRLFKLKDTIAQTGVTNTKILNMPGESLWKKFPEFFDRTLVDVPCSMEGRIKIDDPKSYADWSPKKIKQLSKLQKYILRSAISATKVGGTIVYSTCTLSPEENEEVIQWALEKAAGAVEIEKITIPNLNLQNGLSSWKKKTFTYAQHSSRVTPSATMEGFFIAKLHKKSSTLPSKI